MKLLLIVVGCLIGGSQQDEVEIQASMAPQDRIWTTTQTVTSYSLTTTTFTSAKFVSCIPSTFFLSTTACRRRRSIAESALEDWSPSEPKEVESTEVKEVRDANVPEIESSHDHTDDKNPLEAEERTFTSVVYTTKTSLVTIWSVAYTTLTKTINWGTSASVLLCLPSGFSKC